MPRLIVPSNGGGTKLIRTLRVADGAEVAVGSDVDSGAGDGEIAGVDALSGAGDSCAKPLVRKSKLLKSANETFFLISSQPWTFC